MNRLIDLIKQLLKYESTAIICGVIDYGLLILLVEIFHIHYFWASLAALLTAALGFLMARTAFGRHVCAVGSNERVAKYAGIPVGFTKFLTYCVMGVCVGLSAFLFVGRLSSISSSNAGLLYELDAIAALLEKRGIDTPKCEAGSGTGRKRYSVSRRTRTAGCLSGRSRRPDWG